MFPVGPPFVIRERSLITGRGWGLPKGGGGRSSEVLPLQNGGGGRKSFSHAEVAGGGGGRQSLG